MILLDILMMSEGLLEVTTADYGLSLPSSVGLHILTSSFYGESELLWRNCFKNYLLFIYLYSAYLEKM